MYIVVVEVFPLVETSEYVGHRTATNVALQNTKINISVIGQRSRKRHGIS